MKYCCSDLHGSLEGYRAIKNFIKPEDTVYCLGDCGDRGPESWETIKAVYNDPQFVYLKGNHEDMLVRAMEEWLPEHIKGMEWQLLVQNGGYDTFQDWKNSPERNKWLTRLRNLPCYWTYINSNGQRIIMTHAGYTPPKIPKEDILLWDRKHFNDEWTGGEHTFIVHGHTPVNSITKNKADKDILVYSEGHKIDIDILTWRNKRVALLNLENLEPIYLDYTESE